MLSQSKYRSKLYRDFRAIEPGEWRGIVRFYEEHEKEIRGLDFEEYFELMMVYTDALFEIGAWQKHMLMADAVIEISVMDNLATFNGVDVLRHTLFRKAASHYNLLELEKTEHILRELLRINPHDADCAAFLKKCLRTMRPSLIRQSRALSIGLFLFTGLVILVELLVVHSFYPGYSSTVEALRITTFIIGLVVLAGGELLHRWKSIQEVEDFVKRARGRRRKKH